MTPEIIGSIIRSLLTSFGGVLVTSGYINSDQLNSLSGAAVILVTLAWSIWQKTRAEAKIEGKK